LICGGIWERDMVAFAPDAAELMLFPVLLLAIGTEPGLDWRGKELEEALEFARSARPRPDTRVWLGGRPTLWL
jgi:hypothetical protein